MECQNRLLVLLEESQQQFCLWVEHSVKIVAQLRSMKNLLEQLEAIER